AASFFCAERSGALNQSSISASIFGSVGQPNQAFSPLARTGRLTAGEKKSGAEVQVWKMLQPAFSTGSFEVRRVINVPQSLACNSTLSPALRSASNVTSAWPCTIGWPAAESRTILSPLQPDS